MAQYEEQPLVNEEHDHDHGEHKHDHSHDHDHSDHEHDHSHSNHNHDDHNHDHSHHEHNHDHHDHDHEHGHGWFDELLHALPFTHGHSHGEAQVDAAMETNNRGIWALKWSLVGLGATAIFQLIIALLSGSTGLLADTIHNFSDALTAVPLWIAFSLAKRAPTRSYTYGYGRAEDVAGVIIVFLILLSSLLAAYESIFKLLHPQPLQYAWWVIAAALVGFLGNEGVAIFRMRVGREIGSAALVADGQHARADGLTSLAVIIGAVGTLLGFPLADPIIGLLITIAILFIVKDTGLTMWRRLMDAVDPKIVEQVEQVTAKVPGVQHVHSVRVRWVGHKLQAEVHVTVDEDLPVHAGHHISEEVRHAIFHANPRFSYLIVHADPCGHSGTDWHELTAHHDLFPEVETDYPPTTSVTAS